MRAVDLDTGANGNVTYSLVKSGDQSSVVIGPSGDRFEIDPVSGVVRTADVFDREAQVCRIIRYPIQFDPNWNFLKYFKYFFFRGLQNLRLSAN